MYVIHNSEHTGSKVFVSAFFITTGSLLSLEIAVGLAYGFGPIRGILLLLDVCFRCNLAGLMLGDKRAFALSLWTSDGTAGPSFSSSMEVGRRPED